MNPPTKPTEWRLRHRILVVGGRLVGAADGAGAADLRAARLLAAPGVLARLHARHEAKGCDVFGPKD